MPPLMELEESQGVGINIYLLCRVLYVLYLTYSAISPEVRLNTSIFIAKETESQRGYMPWGSCVQSSRCA